MSAIPEMSAYQPQGWEQQGFNIHDNDLIHVTIILAMMPCILLMYNYLSFLPQDTISTLLSYLVQASNH